MTLYKLNTDVIEYTRPTGIYSYTGTHHQQIDHLVELGILVPVEEKKCCDKCVMFTNGYCDKCHSPKDNPATTVAKFVDFLDKETLNPYDVRVEPTTDKEEWGEALKVEVMEDYIRDAEMLRLSKEKTHCMREHFNKLKAFIRNLLQKSRKDWLREEIQRLEGERKTIKDCGKCNSCESMMSCETAAEDRQFNSALDTVLEFIRSKK